MFKSFLLLIFLFTAFQVFCQNEPIIIDEIILEGNKHTKDRVILQEINLSLGDTIWTNELQSVYREIKLQILSTGLFNDVVVKLQGYTPDQQRAKLKVSLEENWYLFPVPIFELADRNFSVWWSEQGRSLSRVNYGFRVAHYNLTGNKDPIKLKVQFGYTKKYELTYTYPYLSNNSNWGIGGSIFYAENKEIAYITQNNKTLFAKHPDERRMLSRFRIGPEIKYRPDANFFHAFRIEYHRNTIDPFVATDLNPNYFLEGNTSIQFLYMEYDFNYDRRLYRHYPLGGFLLFGNIKKEGFSVFNEFDNLSITAGIEKHWLLKPKLILSTRNKAKTNLIRNTVAYANNTGLGWSQDIVTGYELYVMDGTDYFISMNALKFQLFDNNMNTVKWMPTQFRKMNLSLYLRLNFDFAYVYEPTYIEGNDLNNRIIHGFGPALDIIMFNNYLFSFEYSYNDIGERALYFHNAIAF